LRAQEARGTEQAFERRAASQLLLLDSEFRIVLGDGEAMRLLLPDTVLGSEGHLQMPSDLRNLLRTRLAANGAKGATLSLGNLLLRAVPVCGPLGEFTAVTVEALRRREDLVSQKERYRLTPREVDVLRLVLQGLTAAEAAVVLNIAKSTVTDYFKSLLHKTGARNRSEMIAKILGWDISNNLRVNQKR
jgi:DNA-binding CsgD family transcriptional regulator